MPSVDVPTLLGSLALALGAAKILGGVVRRFGQPAVLGELVAGVILGGSVAGVLDPHDPVLHVLAEIGVVLLLFQIGIETDIRSLLRVGSASSAVAAAGVALPFGLGYAICRVLGLEPLVSIVAGATLTATSVGITARVLSELGRLQDPESQIVLGAAVIDDVIGLVILAVVGGMVAGEEVTTASVVRTTLVAFGFLIAALVVGRALVPPLGRALSGVGTPGVPTALGVVFALGLAWLASVAGSAMIIGAFAAGLLLRDTPQAHDVEKGVAELGHFLVPIFFVVVGAAVDVRVLAPTAENLPTLQVAALLLAAAFVGKLAAGWAPVWFRGNKLAIGIGMVPRGEVGLIFAQMGLASGVFDASLFSAITLVVMATTFVAPVLLKQVLHERPGDQPPSDPSGIADLVNEV